MDKNDLVEKAKLHLHVLCEEIGERRVGSEENRQSTMYAEGELRKQGWITETTELSVVDWKTEGASLTCKDMAFEVFSSHYSLGCSVAGELLVIDSVAQLEKEDIKNKLVLLRGEIATQQIAPKKFPFCL